MSITEIALKRQVGTYLFVALASILGVLSIGKIPVAFWPEFVAPTLIIMAPYPGASPEEVEEQIAKPLEEQLSTIEGIDEIESTCMEGLCRTYARFDWGEDFKRVKLDVQDRVNKATSFFPREALTPKVLQVQDFLPPGLELGFYSSRRSLNEIYDILEKKIKNRILILDNVANVQIFGGNEQEIRVEYDLEKLNRFGISPFHLIQQITSLNRNLTAGKIRTSAHQFLLRVHGKFDNLDDIKRMIIFKTKEGHLIHLEDVARVTFSAKERNSIVRLNGQEIIGLAIREKSGGNTVAMVDEVKEILPALKKSLPEDIQMKIIRDQSLFIRQSINSVLRNALIGALLAGFVIFLFLGNLRNTIIIGISIPLSIIITFILIDVFGLTINIISLGGLALGVGMIVDASVVVLENIFRFMQEKRIKDRYKLVVESTREVGAPIFASTLTSIVVFLPLAFLVGLFSVLLGELALTVVFALSISILVALTVVPLFGYKLIRIQGNTSFPLISKSWQALIENIRKKYITFLGKIIKHPVKAVVGIILLSLLMVGSTLPFIDVALMPSVNQGEFKIEIEGPEESQLGKTDEITKKIELDLSNDPRIRQYYSQVGIFSARGELKPNFSSISVMVTDKNVPFIKDIMKHFREKWENHIPGYKIVVRQTDVTEGMKKAPINIRVAGDDLQTLAEIGKEIERKLSNIPGMINIHRTSQEPLPEISIEINQEECWKHSLDPSTLVSWLHNLIQGTSRSKFSVEGKEYDITLKMMKGDSIQFDQLYSIPVACPDGSILPLKKLVRLHYGGISSEILRINQQRIMEVTADLQGLSRMEAQRLVRKMMQEISLPENYLVIYGGESKAIKDSFRSLSYALLIAILLVYVVMGTQFNSFRQPFIIAFTIPFAFLGVLPGLLLFKAPFSMNAFLGIIMLVGIVVNNGILLIDYIHKGQERGLDFYTSILEAGKLRFRPILITSLTTIFGMFPIALGLGAGGEALRPLGAVVVSGLFISTFFTLLFLPAIYVLFEKKI